MQHEQRKYESEDSAHGSTEFFDDINDNLLMGRRSRSSGLFGRDNRSRSIGNESRESDRMPKLEDVPANDGKSKLTTD